MKDFEQLLQDNLVPLQRYVQFKINNKPDAEDIIQDVCLTATMKFDSIYNPSAFKAWLIGIARHKCNDYYRRQSKDTHVSFDTLSESAFVVGRLGITEQSPARETLDALGNKEKQILCLYFLHGYSQKDIARQLSVPIGTVKSRLHYAKEKFKKQYLNLKSPKGGTNMKKLPDSLPEYVIQPSAFAPFTVKCEELMGFCMLPRLHEKVTWGSYDIPSRKLHEYTDAAVIGRAEVHGIEGVEIVAKQYIGQSREPIERHFIAQLTDTHCRYLAESHIDNGVRKYFTFLDSDIFMNNWGFGEDNCGYETHLEQHGTIQRSGSTIEVTEQKELVDIVGRYSLSINGKTYDTVCVMDIGHFDSRIAIEQYLDQNGRTILWRRFNKNDWAYNRYGKLWTEQLPENERLLINNETYVHWYDCVTDYIF